MTSPAPANIIWLPSGSSPPERRSLFDYESGTFSGGRGSIAGVRINEETALESTVVLACLRVLGESVAGLPLHIYRRLPDGGKEVARAHPLYRILHIAPNDWQTSFEWREQQILHLGTYGQSFSEIIRDSRDVVSELIPLHPSRMTVERVESGALRYRYIEETGGFTVYSQEQVMHIRWLSNDGVNGMVPVQLAKDAIALARACEIHGSAYFGNGARPGVILSTDNSLTAEAAEALRMNWERVHRGPDRSSKTAVLTGGLKPIEIGTNNQESQFLETRRFQIEEICRLYRVPPHLVGDLTRSSFSNVEQQSLDFVQYTLLPWLRRFESAFARDLVGDSDEYFVEFDTRGLLRGDAAGRASYYQTLWNLGVASINEIRGWENLNPVEGGDTRFVQLNMQTLASATKEPEKTAEPEPPAASVNDLVTVLQQVAGGTVAPEAAKTIMAAVFPALDPKSADSILSGIAGPKAEPVQEPPPAGPAADVGGLASVVGQVREGVIGVDAAVATLVSAYPNLPAETARLIVSGVNAPPKPPENPQQPAADVGGLLAVLAQVSQGAVTPEAALSIIDAVYPTMPDPIAASIVGGAKQPQPSPEAAPPPDQPADSPAGESPREARSVISIDFDRTFSANPRLWGEFARASVAGGNTVVMVSRRPDTPENQQEVGETLGDYREAFAQVLLVGDRLKDEAAREAGIEVDVWVDDSPQFVRAPEDRAFCPGASPPDNSCSPSNKGGGAPRPGLPAPDGRVAAGDTRGAVSGHSESQRRAFYEDVRQWASGMGVEMVEPDLLALRGSSPMPTMDSIQCVSEGLARLRELGTELPAKVEIQSIWKEDALAAYDAASDIVLVSADLSSSQLGAGFVAKSLAEVIVHEASHRDHVRLVGRDKFEAMSLGIDQDEEAPSSEDWDSRATWNPKFRVSSSTMSSEEPGKPLSADEAYSVAATVSGYATVSPSEFVAELRTSLSRNPKRSRFPKAAFSLYEDYGGPPLPADAKSPSGIKNRR